MGKRSCSADDLLLGDIAIDTNARFRAAIALFNKALTAPRAEMEMVLRLTFMLNMSSVSN
jgi:hypothetical protein